MGPIPISLERRVVPLQTSALSRRIIEAPSIVEVLERRAATEIGVALRFLADGEDDVQDWTFQDLQTAAAGIAGALRADGHAGQRVVLALEPGPSFITGLFGILRAGCVAVPSFPPVGPRAADRLRAIVVDSRPGAVLVPERMRDRVDRLMREVDPGIRTVAYELEGNPEPGPLPAAAADDLAMIQYTSGSTSHPRGVALSHENVMSNCRTLLDRMGWEADRIGCSWLPPYHDMGLLGTIILSVYGAWPFINMAPAHFVQRPLRWLKAISDHGATVSVSPNSGLDICVDGISDEELEQLDLSRLRQVFCGAEPIHAATLERFKRRFTARGMADVALTPCYGLAEATLHVTAKPDRTSPRALRLDRRRLELGTATACSPEAARDAVAEIVSCGVPAADHNIVVIDVETLVPVPDGVIGEIWVAGPNVALGYFDATVPSNVVAAEPFGARLPGDGKSWLRTGDLGFVQDGELFVTGRRKDVVVVVGRNLYPYDVERAALTACADLRQAVAFGVSGDQAPEQLVVVGELRCRTSPGDDALGRIRRAVTAAVNTATGVAPADVHLGPIGTIPTTTSGKVRRLETRHGYIDRTLRVFPSAAQNALIAEGNR